MLHKSCLQPRALRRVFVVVLACGLFLAVLLCETAPLLLAQPAASAQKTSADSSAIAQQSGKEESSDAARVVRVAFFPMRGFHHYDRTGKPAGYGVDYLERVATYARWDVCYVPMESWGAALAAVENGEADIMGAVLMTPERARRIGFSALPAGRTREVMITDTESTLVYEDFAAFNGLRVGCVRSSLRVADFAAYAQRHGFTPELVYFDTVNEMRQAMHAGQVDTMLAAVLELLPGERILADFAPASFYFVANKNASDLLDELDVGMTAVKRAEPDFDSRLMGLWYPQAQVFPFTREELDYIKSQQQVSMCLFANRGPFSWIDESTGEFSGIVPDVLALISRESGLDFVLSSMSENVIPADALEAGQIPAAAGIVRYEEQLRDRRIIISDAFYDSSIIMLGRKGAVFNPALPLRIAVQPGFRAVLDYLNTSFPHFRQVAVKSTAEALDAVRDGRADGFMQNTYLLQPFLQGPRYAELTPVPEVSLPESLAIAFPAHTDPLLISVLNKSIRRLKSDEVRQIAINHILSRPYVMTLNDILLHYREPIQIIVGLGVLCLILLAYGIHARRKNVRLIRANEETLKNITNNINGGVITLSTGNGFHITYANQGFLNLLGYNDEEYRGRSETDCLAYIHPDEVFAFYTTLRERDRGGEPVVADVRIRHKDGSYIPVMLRGTVGRNAAGKEQLYCVIVDISEQKNMIRALGLEKERYRILLEQSSDMLFEYDAAAHFISCSPKFRVAFAMTARIGEAFHLPLHPEDEPLMDAMLLEIQQHKGHTVRRVRLRQPDGVYSWCRLVLSGVAGDGSLQRIMGRIEDINAEVLEQQRLEALARRDSLCGLYNRVAFRAMVEEYLRAGGMERDGALFFIDLDNFKKVNDLLGHQVGDQTLKDVAVELKKLFRESDPVSRYGGDEYCVYARDMSEERARERAVLINKALSRSYTGEDGTTVHVSASVGVARNPVDGVSYDILMDKADKALYQAKSDGRDRTTFATKLKSAEPDFAPTEPTNLRK